MSMIPLVLVLVGIILIALGAWMAIIEWEKKVEGESGAQSHALNDNIEAFAKLLDALKDYPTGQQLIVFGILILIIAGIFGGVQCLD